MLLTNRRITECSEYNFTPIPPNSNTASTSDTIARILTEFNRHKYSLTLTCSDHTDWLTDWLTDWREDIGSFTDANWITHKLNSRNWRVKRWTDAVSPIWILTEIHWYQYSLRYTDTSTHWDALIKNYSYAVMHGLKRFKTDTPL